MPTQDYRLKDKTRVPGVTTVISTSLGWNRQALMWWAWNEGKEGRNYKVTKDAAAEAGTLAHSMIEVHLKNGHPWAPPANVDPAVLAKAQTAFGAFLEFETAVGLKVLETETAYVSETHHFGGCIDIASIKNKRAIVDIKTSKDIYPDHKIQLAAYGRLWNEHHPDEPIEAYYILQLGKEDGSFAYHFYPNLDLEWECFTHLLALYWLKKKVDR